MYIKATKTHTDKDGQSVRSHRLVLAQRIGDKVRHRTLLNLGTDYPVPKEKWREVAGLAEALLNGRPPLLEAAPDVQAAAEDIVAKLRARGFRVEAMQEEARKPEVATVDLDTLEHENPRTVGCERLCLKALDDLGFADILHGLGIKGRDGRIASALIVARMVHPASERETSRWLRHDSATAELLELEGERKALRRKTLYRIGDLLWRHRAAIQRELFSRERSLLDIPDTIAFYDLTNVHYHGHTDGELPRFGRSKQKRDDCPLITLALALDGAGFPRSCEILPGNVSEPGTLEDALVRLEAVCGGTAPKPTVVMDAGIATEENIAWLGERGYHWIAVSRGARPAPPEGGPEALLITSADQEVRAWRLASEDGEARLYVVSEGKKKAENGDHRPAEEPLRGGAGKAPRRPPGQGPPQALRQGAGEHRPPQAALLRRRQALRDHGREGGHRPQRRRRALQAQAPIRRGRRGRGRLCASHQPHRLGYRDDPSDVLADHGYRGDIQKLEIRARPSPDLAPARPAHRGPPADRRAGLPRRASDPHPAGRAGHPQVLGIDPREHADLGADHHAPAPDRRHLDRQPPGHAPGRRGRPNLLGGGREPRHPPHEDPPDELTKSNKMWGHVGISREKYRVNSTR